ncbi:MAG TPA: nucleoside triphosphate pyrophosphohydrolase [Steroidobacteraceae bacterium]|nr:nucleoside triphosphate pyrophosphohydrolase [Steroidobacteraceae bacterium]
MSTPVRGIDALLAVMARLRDPRTGCPWDLAQSFETIAPYTLEEAYEVADAIASGQRDRLRDELGDLLFQVVFHARMAEERGWFAFDDVAAGIERKLVRRHPHVFAPQADADAARRWEEIKATERTAAALERGEPPPGALAGVPLALPALARAAKLGQRAARVGFDWPDAKAVREKITEELAELDAAQASAALTEELGDLLFTLVNFARHTQIDAEGALRAANAKFERRFIWMERTAAARGRELSALTPEEWDALWRESKLATAPEPPPTA